MQDPRAETALKVLTAIPALEALTALAQEVGKTKLQHLQRKILILILPALRRSQKVVPWRGLPVGLGGQEGKDLTSNIFNSETAPNPSVNK